MKILYVLYQLFIAAPILLPLTVLTAVATFAGCTFGNAAFWSYQPMCWWGKAMCWLMLLPVHVEGRELIRRDQSYVFVANHQGSYDIFLIAGFLGHSFRWMMKASLREMPLLGSACERAGHIMVERSNAGGVRRTIRQAHQVLQGGVSLMAFPEGARTFCGTMGFFRKGVFLLADDLQLPVVPVTIDGSFDVLPRQRRIPFLTWHRLRLVIHAPIPPKGKGDDNIQYLMSRSREAIEASLPLRHQGYQSNHDQ